MTNDRLATEIMVLAISSPNSDVLTCEFGNWFTPRVKNLLNKYRTVSSEVEDEKVFKSVVSKYIDEYLKDTLGNVAPEVNAMEWLRDEIFENYELRRRG